MNQNPRAIPSMLSKAVELHQRGQLAAAEALYRQILEFAPNQPDALHLLGLAAHMHGRHAEAVQLIGKAVVASPSNPAFHNNLATVLRTMGNLEEAVACYRRALALRPDYAEAQGNLANILTEVGRPEQALVHYRHALGLRDAPEFRANFARCVQDVAFRSIDAGTTRLLLRAMTEAWGRPGDLARAAASALRADPIVGPCIERAAEAWPLDLTSEELFAPSGISPVSADALLRALLEHAQLVDPAMERFVTLARRALLAMATETNDFDDEDPSPLALQCSIARQCFLNDYVFSCTDAEMERVDATSAELAHAIADNAPIRPRALASIAGYRALLSLPGIESIATRPWPAAIAALFTQQVVEPLHEQRLRAAIPQLTPIDDAVSRKVRDQYEENPYPRWVKLPKPAAPVSLDLFLRGHFPLAPAPLLAARGPVDILVAGCGTGQESNELALAVSDAQVLAIDLSTASLAYAQRKANELGLRNIEHGQADILQMPSLGRRFDFITASGVLHHIADPAAALRALVALLRPGGVMRVGLYSELGRSAVVEARRMIAERGYTAIPTDIRRCRQEILSCAPGSPLEPLRTSRSLYGTSECRDLLFHVEEHRFTVPQIRGILDAVGLAFLGFSVKPSIGRRYAERNRDDPTQTDLDRWHAFETQFPNTFAAMYQFLVRKDTPRGA